MADEHELERGYSYWLEEFQDKLWGRPRFDHVYNHVFCIRARQELRSMARCLRILRAVRSGAVLARRVDLSEHGGLPDDLVEW